MPPLPPNAIPKEVIVAPKVDITALAAKDVIPTDSEVESALKSQGLIKVSANSMKELKTIGVHLDTLGIVRTERGGVFVHRSKMERMMQILVERAEHEAGKKKGISIKNAAILSGKAALLGGKITESYKLMLDSVGGRGRTPILENESDTPRRKSFAPGTLVQINVGDKSQVRVEEKTVASPDDSS